MSRPVVYCRGDDSVEIAATLGGTDFEVANDAGAVVQARSTDFIVPADALVLGGVKIAPQVGDRIRVPAGAKVLVFEVLDMDGTGHFRPADPYRRTWRIHTKQVDEEG